MKKIGEVPTGIFILAAILFLKGFQYLLTAPFAVFSSILIAVFSLLIGAYFVICASKLIKLQYQGWQLATIGYALYLLLALARIALSGNLNAEITGAIFDAIIAAAVLVYLNRPAIKNIFRK